MFNAAYFWERVDKVLDVGLFQDLLNSFMRDIIILQTIDDVLTNRSIEEHRLL